MNRIIRWIALVFIVLSVTHFLGNPLFAQEKVSLKTVVIDAGHGGKDPGTIGQRVQEKKITLAIALKLGKLIRENDQNIHVLYTRDKDEFIELHERADIANRNKADLFVSIHCNANPSHALHGVETYVMGLHRSEANLDIAKKENASILMEPDYNRNYNGFDPNSDESYITFSLFQNAFMDQSTAFASTIQHEMKDRTGMNDRGVRQAGFLVLYKTTMPSVLVETGFLSNPEEEKFLISEEGQEYIAAAIFKAFQKFRKTMERTSSSSIKESGSVQPAMVSLPAQKDSGIPAKAGPIEKKCIKEAKTSPVDPTKEPLTKKKDLPAKPDKKTPVLIPHEKVWFCVQVAISPKEIGTQAKKFEGLSEVRMYRHEGVYKYTTGNEQTVGDALKLLETVKKKGFSDAFVVAFNGEERITIEQARKLMRAQ